MSSSLHLWTLHAMITKLSYDDLLLQALSLFNQYFFKLCRKTGSLWVISQLWSADLSQPSHSSSCYLKGSWVLKFNELFKLKNKNVIWLSHHDPSHMKDADLNRACLLEFTFWFRQCCVLQSLPHQPNQLMKPHVSWAWPAWPNQFSLNLMQEQSTDCLTAQHQAVHQQRSRNLLKNVRQFFN